MHFGIIQSRSTSRGGFVVGFSLFSGGANGGTIQDNDCSLTLFVRHLRPHLQTGRIRQFWDEAAKVEAVPEIEGSLFSLAVVAKSAIIWLLLYAFFNHMASKRSKLLELNMSFLLVEGIYSSESISLDAPINIEGLSLEQVPGTGVQLSLDIREGSKECHLLCSSLAQDG
ncbi:hypothetical protein SADUNF_Sadunf18G0048100 [Salix dunnii]|uniref:Uncharacterized protein n=1 Tax=Salix dunnii TaxID=1413687 RepID=A0A835J4C5_9ROSI|nr:hypothetical protein SADUNF_Sadunf18G0048100 [Salix dunnii]